MKYTKNIHNKLILNGFMVKDEYERNEGKYLNYTVYEKGVLEVTVYDSHKTVTVEINAENEILNDLKLSELFKIDKIINSKIVA